MEEGIIWVPVIVGAIVAVCGVAMPFVKPGTTMPAIAAIGFGLIFASIPLISKATANSEGFTFETFKGTSEDLRKGLTDNTNAIAAINASLGQLKDLVTSLQTSATGSGALPLDPARLRTFNQNFDRRLSTISTSLEDSRAAAVAAEQKLQNLDSALANSPQG